jgi:hypothetical protein
MLNLVFADAFFEAKLSVQGDHMVVRQTALAVIRKRRPIEVNPIALENMRLFSNISAAVLLAAASVAPSQSVASTVWEPVCPDGIACATSFPPYLAGGKILISSPSTSGPNYWIDPFRGSPPTFIETAMRLPSLPLARGYMAIDLSGGTVYDSNGVALYTFNQSGLGPDAFGLNYVTLGPAVAFGGTNPYTIITGVGAPAGLPKIYQSRDDGRTWLAQTANIAISSDYVNGSIRKARTNFLTSPRSTGVWVVPGPVTPGLWMTPARTSNNEPLDFTRLERIDDGSFPADVFQLKSWPNAADVPDGYVFALASDGMYVSVNIGRSWNKSTFTGLVDDVDSPPTGRQIDVFAPPRTPDHLVIAARDTVFISRDRGQTWSPFAHGLPADRYALTAASFAGTIMVLAYGAGGVFLCNAGGPNLACDGNGFGKAQVLGSSFARVVEFYHASLDHFFITGDEAEKSLIRSGGAGAGWVETGDAFWAWSPDWRQEAAYVCRFYGDLQFGPNSHFFSGSTSECNSLLDRELAPASGPRWVSEGYAFKVGLPTSAGQCAQGLIPVYRAYNNGFAKGIDSNHRFTTRSDLIEAMTAMGWINEGIAFCVPTSGS